MHARNAIYANVLGRGSGPPAELNSGRLERRVYCCRQQEERKRIRPPTLRPAEALELKSRARSKRIFCGLAASHLATLTQLACKSRLRRATSTWQLWRRPP